MQLKWLAELVAGALRTDHELAGFLAALKAAWAKEKEPPVPVAWVDESDLQAMRNGLHVIKQRKGADR